MNLVARWFLVFATFAGLAGAPACQPGFAGIESSQQLAVTITSGSVGSPTSRLPISFTTATTFTVDIRALDSTGNLDKTFNGYVRASVVPGTVQSVTGANTSGRNALLTNGEATGIQISIAEAYGDARIVVEDVGYVPADPLGARPPQCANGKDDNQNGKIDYPVDPGCYAANDDTEAGGTYAAAVTDTLYFDYPRTADIRGVSIGCSTTPFPNQQVQINTAWSVPSKGSAPSGIVVTGIGSAGFYVTDLSDPRGCSSVYAYTYSAPPIMLPCDRLVTFGGTASEFYGFTELNYPTWTLEEWDPTVRDCFVPEPTLLVPANDCTTIKAPDACLNPSDTAPLIQLEAALVRVAKSSTTSIHIGKNFGPGLVDQKTYKPTPTASNCDYNGDGKLDFTVGSPEYNCSNACTADVECSEYSNFLSQSQFRIVVVNSALTTTVEADAAADASFDPLLNAGKEIAAFTGNLIYFSGGKQFTIQARCSDDVVADPTKKPLPSSKACVVARNAANLTGAN